MTFLRSWTGLAPMLILMTLLLIAGLPVSAGAGNPLIGEAVVPPGLADWAQVRADAAAGKLAVDEDGIPVGLNTALRRESKRGLYRVFVSTETAAPPMNAMHAWSIRIMTAIERPARGAKVEVFGGMPLHGHGFPTEPAVVETGGGVYELRGMKFNMNGWWQVMLLITVGDVTDVVTFDIPIRPEG